ncbi:hypothetical protein [Shewanella woodyi]|uniref:hypothetical protein n=1 Tax=Shewanella woodyi TaxID=60961 RepID=UPI003748E41F
MRKLVVFISLFMTSCSGITNKPLIVENNQLQLNGNLDKILILVDESQKSSLILSERLNLLARKNKLETFPLSEYLELKEYFNEQYYPLYDSVTGERYKDNLLSRDKALSFTLHDVHHVDLIVNVNIYRESVSVDDGYFTWKGVKQFKSSELFKVIEFGSVYSVRVVYTPLVNGDVSTVYLGLSATDDLENELLSRIQDYDSVFLNILKPIIKNISK